VGYNCTTRFEYRASQNRFGPEPLALLHPRVINFLFRLASSRWLVRLSNAKPGSQLLILDRFITQVATTLQKIIQCALEPVIDIIPSIDYSSLPVTVKSGAVLTSPNVNVMATESADRWDGASARVAGSVSA
jgi:hypothetical protein